VIKKLSISLLGLAITLIGGAAIIGYLTGQRWMFGWINNTTPMAFNTAVCFFLTGICLYTVGKILIKHHLWEEPK